MRLAMILAGACLFVPRGDGQLMVVSVRSVTTSLNVEASGDDPFDTININLDLVLRNKTKRAILVAPGAVQAGSVERRRDTGEWKTILTIDSFFGAGGPAYARCGSLRPGRSLIFPRAWSNVVLPKSERDPNRKV